MTVIAKRPDSLRELGFTYCPGCLHGVAHRLIAEAVDELGLKDVMTGVAPVGCSVFAYKFFDFDIAGCSWSCSSRSDRYEESSS